MTKNNQDFHNFLRDEVNLNQSRLNRLNTSVSAVNSFLRDHLTGYQKMESQGSHALGTLIKPVDDNDEYDADMQVVMNPNDEWEAKDYVNNIRRTLNENKNYADKLRLKTRCVTVDYAGDFHLDVVPRVTIGGDHYVCNRIDNKFEETDGTGYRDWFNQRNRITRGNLKRVVRLLKYLRDHKNNFSAKSILLTTLAGNTIEESDEGTEAVRTVADTLVTVLGRIDEFLQRYPVMPQIRNPVLWSETFNRHWDQTKYANFRNRIHSHAQTAKDARDTESSEDAIRLWRSLFGKEFGKGSSNGGNGSASLGKPPSGPGGGQAIYPPFVPVRPRRQYASLDAVNDKLEEISVSMSDREVFRLSQQQPCLNYDAQNNRIIGKLEFSARFDSYDGLLKPAPASEEGLDPMVINESFEIEVRLSFQPTAYNPWPPVIETSGRIQDIMGKQGIANIADMHCYPGLSENRCCLDFKIATGERINVPKFIGELVIPFFYRVAYVERYGLEAARNDLWKECPHDFRQAEREYLTELRDMRGLGRNMPCPCGSGLKYKKCHLPEVVAAKLL